MIATSGFVIAV